MLVAGAGLGLGAALARRFAAAGHPVALGARSGAAITAVADEITAAGGRALALPYDVSDEEAVAGAIDRLEAALGPVQFLLYNAGNYVPGGVDQVRPEEFRAAWETGPWGAFLHARRLLPSMAQRREGAVLFTGATSSVHAPGRAPAFASAKFGLRGLAMSLMRQWGPQGVHIAHLLIDGAILTPRAAREAGDAPDYLRPADIAETYYQVATQAPSSWSFELDLRPFTDDYLEN